MLTCVILNYNDSDTTLSLYHKIKNYNIIDKIIIVDGASTDFSYNKLKVLSNDHTDVLLADRNGGYGYGNNIGIRYSESIGADYVLIANPDVEFSETAVQTCLNIMKTNKNCAAIAPSIIGRKHPAFAFAPPIKDALSSSILCNRIFSPRYYPSDFYKGKKYCKVFALPGSLVMLHVKKFIQCGLYDEDVFLYNEELIIGKKFKDNSYESILCMTESYRHLHAVTVQKNYHSLLQPKKIELKSHRLYLVRYCNSGKLPLLLLSCIKPMAYLECILWPWLKKFLNKLQ